jgi:hypothetical protein
MRMKEKRTQKGGRWTFSLYLFSAADILKWNFYWTASELWMVFMVVLLALRSSKFDTILIGFDGCFLYFLN